MLKQNLPTTYADLNYIDTVFTTDFMRGKTVDIYLDDYKHHHNSLSNLLYEADIPLALLSIIMRINKIGTTIPENKKSITVPSSELISLIAEELLN